MAEERWLNLLAKGVEAWNAGINDQAQADVYEAILGFGAVDFCGLYNY